MATVVRKVATITQKGQATVPKSVREALGVDNGERIVFSVDEDRRVSIEREDDETDPVVESFLTFLAEDMRKQPGASIVDIPESLRGRMERLTAGIAVDPDDPIDGDVDL